MSSNRKLVFANDYYYHIFNRGIDRRVTFSNKREYQRMLDLMFFYQFKGIPLRYSQFSALNADRRSHILNSMIDSGKSIEIVSYCLMPNHFHLLIRQKQEKGISTYLSNFVNAYTKYFNIKHKRLGLLFQGTFKAVFIETEEQLLHVTRYIHLNPVVSSLIRADRLINYPWSSYPSYISNHEDNLVKKNTSGFIKAITANYEKFCLDQVAYGKELEKIKHLFLIEDYV